MRASSILQWLVWFTVLCSGGCPARAEDHGALRPAGLRCEYAVDPPGIDERSPRPSWIGESTRKGERQSAYQVLVSSTGGNTLAALVANGWYSGHLGNGGFQQYSQIPALLAQLEIVHADGTLYTANLRGAPSVDTYVCKGGAEDVWQPHPLTDGK